MNYHKRIFNQKTLNRVLSRIGVSSIPNLKGKQEIISRWIQSLQSGKLGNIKETSIDQKFLDDFFVRVLGYQGVIGGSEEWNIIPQQKMKVTTNRADGALGYFSNEQEDIRAVIELKDANTDLDSPQHRRNDKRTPVQQAFGYAPEVGKTCKWVIVSNFKELRLYHRSTQDEYEVFSIEKLLEPETFKKFYYFLSKENLIAKDGESEIEKLYRSNTEEEEKISHKFYGEYKAARNHLFEHLKKNNPEKDEMLLLEKTQKILDRFIFVCFCEDKGLLPARIFRGTLEQARNVIIELEDKNWIFIQALFKAINDGKPEHDINKFDGGLFAPDDELDTLKLTDAVFEELAKITDYDFDTDLNVNILGHIFEQSISDLEEIKAEINGERIDKKKGKRKKEGIYYTPEYITRYIVENAIGGWLEDRKKELGFYDLPELTGKDYESVKVKKRAYNDNIKRHLDFWEAYKSRLENIKVLDPACGSGAFLNQAFDYLYGEGQRVNEEIAKLKRGTHSLVDLDKNILSNNLYGVDLNSESVEITKLSLWLKTASKHKELTALDENIKCGNSLIDDSEIAGEKAFKWEAEFTQIMQSGGFDVVIGNPPYVNGIIMQETIPIQRKWMKNNYDCLIEKWDLYLAFIERGLNILNLKGYLSFVIPDSFLTEKYSSKLRKQVTSRYRIVQIDYFPNLELFVNIGVHNVIVFIQKNKLILPIKKVKHLDLIGNKLNRDEYELNDAWSDFDKIELKINRDNREYYQLGDICFISKGIVFNADEKKYKDEFTKNDLISDNPTQSHSRKLLEGKAVSNYFIDSHRYVEWDTERVPNKVSRPTFTELHQPNKLVTNKIGSLKVAFDDMGFVCDQTVRILIKWNQISSVENKSIKNSIAKYSNYDRDKLEEISSLYPYKFLIILLNSRLLQCILNTYRGPGSIDLNPLKLRQLPIPKIIDKDIQQPFIEKADRMMDLNKQFHHAQNEFLDWLKIQYGLEKQSKKLESFYELDEEAFFVELKKKLPKENKNLSPKQTGEIKQYFEDYRQKMLALKNEIEKTDSEIDEMVYELYGLTKEEIEIVRR